MGGLAGKTVLVTGAAGNLGRAVAAGALAAGANVALTDRSAALLEERFADGGNIALFETPDLSDDAAAGGLVARTVERFGRLDAAISTVGGFAFANVADDSRATWERMAMLNVYTALAVSRAALPALKAAGGGAIVLVGAAAGLRAPAGVAAYAASKSAVMRLAESLAEECRADGVRVNCVLPTTMDTPENRAAMPDADRSGWVSPESIADTMLFLASDAARAVTGALVPVSGAGKG